MESYVSLAAGHLFQNTKMIHAKFSLTDFYDNRTSNYKIFLVRFTLNYAGLMTEYMDK